MAELGQRHPAETCLRTALLGLVVFLCAAALGACGSSTKSNGTSSSAKAKAPVSVALITFKTPGEDQLTPMIEGAQAAMKVLDAQGGFGGRSVKLVTCNDMFATATATECAHKTVKDNPVAMIGCSIVWGASGLPVYAAAGIPSINCLNSDQDFTSKATFGVTPATVGDAAALAAYVCTLPSVKTMVATMLDVSVWHDNYKSILAPALKACGKTAVPIYVPATAVDVSPYVAKAMQSKPDFVFAETNSAQIPQLYTAFARNGVPASHIATPGVNFSDTALAHAPSMKGAIDVAEFEPWTNASDPNVAAFAKAAEAAGVDYKNPNVEWGYSLMMWLHAAAKNIGFSKFSAATLMSYLGTATNVPIPLSHYWVNPGPPKRPSIKQPAALLLQWTGTTFDPLPVGPKKDGWISGL